MSTVPVGSGVVLGFGGSNARVGHSAEGDISGFYSVPTPTNPPEFFAWMARQVLGAAHDGSEWVVAGYPGPVTPDGKFIGPMKNVKGLANEQYDVLEMLNASDAAVGRLIDEGFKVMSVNDGELAAHAAAYTVGNFRYDRTAALILGTGVGAGVVIRDPEHKDIYRADRINPLEIGHIILSDDPYDSIENAVSGTALEKMYNQDAREIPADHPAWKRVGEFAGRLATMLGLMNGVQLVVPCGGVGAGASEKYLPHLNRMIEVYRTHGNGPQKLFLPRIVTVPSAEAQIFELFGGEGVMRDVLTRAA